MRFPISEMYSISKAKVLLQTNFHAPHEYIGYSCSCGPHQGEPLPPTSFDYLPRCVHHQVFGVVFAGRSVIIAS